MPEVPKLSVGAICFTSFGSNGGGWVALVIFQVNLFFSEEKVFFLHLRPTPPPPKSCTPEKFFLVKKDRNLRQKKVHVIYGRKAKTPLAFFSAINLHFP